MDSLIVNQANHERTLSDIEERVIAELAETFEFISNGCKEQDKSLAVMERALDSFNVRLLDVREVAGEDCINTVENICRDQFALTGNIIENAHRTWRPSNDNSRHNIRRVSNGRGPE